MKKSYLYAMIILTSIFFFLALFGTTNHFIKYYEPTKKSSSNKTNNGNNKPDKPVTPTNPDKPVTPTNPDKPSDGTKEINGYVCKTDSCAILSGTQIINDKYVFISDGVDNIVLFNIIDKKEEYVFSLVKQTGNLFIAVNNQKYGLISVGESINKLVDFNYTYIDYNQLNNQYMITSGSRSYIADSNGKQISPEYTAQILEYNEKYIVTKTKNNEYHVFNFNNKEYLTEYVNTKRIFIGLVGDYVGVITNDYKYIIYDFREGTKTILEYELTEANKDARARISNNKLEIYKGSTVLKSIDL